MRLLLLSFLVLFSCSLTAQSLTGIWRGKRTQGSQGCFPEYFLELHITWSNETSMMGNAYSYVNDKQFTKVNFTGKYNPLNKRMVITESAVLQYSVPANCIPCIKIYDLIWSKNGAQEALLGDWQGHEMGNNTACPPGKITLNRESIPTFPVDIFQNDSLLKLQQNLKLQNREKEVVQTLTIDTSNIKIELYDNAEIDDDTVSIFLNNTLLLHKKRLTDKPLTVQFSAFPNMEYELMMYAENLGRIPPNTSLMVITAGKKRYEVRLSSSEQKSAVVKFKYLR
ncbi:hypothetical protein [Paraflavitalea sp. CAU 1676]|uniref:hypothetical protein n=1 Tax=Paraflavitalea sp. CAU 1676 TaxID=3032598 RepID=UPI0023DAE1BD|nr:hypothetical protein [Paraflavitalea sp. CAU 1676]MDF2192098.1 hypothetical protein [Paraflavitalea sp. CAU 1676]